MWDYAGDGYVHRLIQSKTDGKLVEVPSPAPACGHHRGGAGGGRAARRRGGAGGGGGGGGAGPCGSGGGGGGGGARRRGYGEAPDCGAGGDGEDDEDYGSDADADGAARCAECAHDRDMKAAMVESKLDAISFEYNALLTSQLDSQRQHFEAVVARARAEADARAAAAERAAAAAGEAAARAEGASKEADRKRAALERKLVRCRRCCRFATAATAAATNACCLLMPHLGSSLINHAPTQPLQNKTKQKQTDAQAALAKAAEERDFLRSLNETLLANQKAFSDRLKAAEAAAAEKDAAVADLKEQVRDLMVYIEAGRHIAQEAAAAAAEGGGGGGSGGSGGAGSELAEATLLPLPAAPAARGRGRSKRGGGRK